MRDALRGLGIVVVCATSTVGAEREPLSKLEFEARLATPREGPLPGGMYQILHGARRYADMLDASLSTLDFDPAFVTFYRDLGRPYPREVCAIILERGAIPVISLELDHWVRGPSVPHLPEIVAGEYDDFFRRYAADAAASKQPVLFRFGFEMNGDWFSWGMDPELYKAAWARIHAIFDEAGCDNVLWTWSPNALSGPDTPENAMERYWPGRETVDVIGLDGYNFGDHHDEWHQWQSITDIFAPALDKIAAADLDLPVLIAEFGCTHDAGGDRRASWIRHAYEYLDNRPEVVGAIWFHLDKRREGEKDWRLDADAPTHSAWCDTFGGWNKQSN